VPTKILFLSANPRDTSQLQLDEEVRLISQRIRRGEYRKLFDIRLAPAIRATDLPYELMDHMPDVVHFSGHGTRSGELLFSDGSGRGSVPIPAQTLARVFKQLRDRIKCVVLNACFSEIQARAIAESIPCVVGMSRTVPDATAIAFAAGFYEGLAFGKSIAEAFELGQLQIELDAPADSTSAGVPQLIVRSGEDAAEIRLFPRRTSAVETEPTKESPANPWAAAVIPAAAGSRTLKIGRIESSGDASGVRIGQYGPAEFTGAEALEVQDIQMTGMAAKVIVEQKKK
jgi:hypothetical protein